MTEAARTVAVAFVGLAAGLTWYAFRTASIPTTSPDRLVAELRLSQFAALLLALIAGDSVPVHAQQQGEKLPELTPFKTMRDSFVQTFNGQALQVFESQPLPARDPKGIGGKMGEIVDISTEGFTVVCADGRIKVLRVKPADGPKCAAGEFATNAKLNLGTRLS